MITAKEALKKALDKYPQLEHTGVSIDYNDVYVFELVRDAKRAGWVDCLFSVNKKTGRVKEFQPMMHSDYFDKAKQISIGE